MQKKHTRKSTLVCPVQSFPSGPGRRIDRGLPQGEVRKRKRDPMKKKGFWVPRVHLYRSPLGQKAGSVFKVFTMHFGQAIARVEGLGDGGVSLYLFPKSSSESLS